MLRLSRGRPATCPLEHPADAGRSISPGCGLPIPNRGSSQTSRVAAEKAQEAQREDSDRIQLAFLPFFCALCASLRHSRCVFSFTPPSGGGTPLSWRYRSHKHIQLLLPPPRIGPPPRVSGPPTDLHDPRRVSTCSSASPISKSESFQVHRRLPNPLDVISSSAAGPPAVAASPTQPTPPNATGRVRQQRLARPFPGSLRPRSSKPYNDASVLFVPRFL